MYDETYGVIYEVIARKFRAFMEPFWDLKISILYVDACIQRIHYKPSATFSDKYTAGWTLRVLHLDSVRTMLTTFYHMNHYTLTGHVVIV